MLGPSWTFLLDLLISLIDLSLDSSGMVIRPESSLLNNKLSMWCSSLFGQRTAYVSLRPGIHVAYVTSGHVFGKQNVCEKM